MCLVFQFFFRRIYRNLFYIFGKFFLEGFIENALRVTDRVCMDCKARFYWHF